MKGLEGIDLIEAEHKATTNPPAPSVCSPAPPPDVAKEKRPKPKIKTRQKKALKKRIVLQDPEVTLLTELNQNPNIAQSAVVLTTAANSLTLRTVGRRLARLEKLRLVCRPNGPRKGWIITLKGQDQLKEIEE